MQPGVPHLSVSLGKRPQDSTANLVFNWIINTGKIIIVSVELLTLGALGYRFYVDRQIVDLHDQIQHAQLFVTAQAKKENLYRNLEDRLTSINTINAQAQRKAAYLKQLISLINTNEFISSNLNVSDTTVEIDGQTYSIFTLNSLIDKLKKNPNVISISLDELTSLDQGIRFKLTTQIIKDI